MTENNTAAVNNLSPVRASAARMYTVVMGVGVFCAVAIVTVYEFTRPIIKQKTIEFRNQAILDVLPVAHTITAHRLNESGEFEKTTPDSTESNLVFAGYNADNKLIGLAIEAQGMGYQDIIRVLYGYSFSKQAIVGIRILQSRETPGVGDRVETDEDFLAQFSSTRRQLKFSTRQSGQCHRIRKIWRETEGLAN